MTFDPDHMTMVINKNGVSCNFDCDHCGVEAGDGTVSEDMTAANYAEVLERGAEAGYESLGVTGGIEPTLDWPRTEHILQEADELGYHTKMVTSAWWANDPKMAEDWIEDIKFSSLDQIDISYEVFHDEELQKYTSKDEETHEIIARATHMALEEDIDVRFYAFAPVDRAQENRANYAKLASELVSLQQKPVSLNYSANGFLDSISIGVCDELNIISGRTTKVGYADQRLPESSFETSKLIQKVGDWQCGEDLHQTVVLTDGEMVPCCDYGAENQRDQYKAGNAQVTTLEEFETAVSQDPHYSSIMGEGGFRELLRELSDNLNLIGSKNEKLERDEVEEWLSNISSNSDDVDLTEDQLEELQNDLEDIVLEREYTDMCRACNDIRDALTL